MLCAVCQRPLLEGVTACIMCGAPVGPPPQIAPEPGGPPPPMPQFDAYAPQAAPAGYVPAAPYRGPMTATAQAPDNGLAVASFVCGLLGLVPLWIGFVLCVLAVIFGVLGLQRANVAMGKGRGLAIAGIVLGLVFVLPAACGL